MQSQGASSTAPEYEPLRELLLLILGQHAAAVVATLVRLELAERLAERPWTAEEIAADASTDPASTLRLLRAAAGLRVVDQMDDTTFAGNCRTNLLARHPGSLREIALAVTEPGCSRLLELLPDAIAKGESVALPALGTDIWSYRDAHPQARMAMTDRLLDLEGIVLPAVRRHLDLSTLRVIVAIGGDQGRFLAGLLRHAPSAHGVLFDRPQAVRAAVHMMASWGLGDRVRCVGGDFTQRVPVGGDLYVLKGVLHDQNDESASWLLDSCYMAAPPQSRLLAVEGVLPDGIHNHPLTQLIDINALITADGRERTVAEIEDLFNASGYVVESVTQLEPTSFRPVAVFVARRS